MYNIIEAKAAAVIVSAAAVVLFGVVFSALAVELYRDEAGNKKCSGSAETHLYAGSVYIEFKHPFEHPFSGIVSEQERNIPEETVHTCGEEKYRDDDALDREPLCSTESHNERQLYSREYNAYIQQHYEHFTNDAHIGLDEMFAA